MSVLLPGTTVCTCTCTSTNTFLWFYPRFYHHQRLVNSFQSLFYCCFYVYCVVLRIKDVQLFLPFKKKCYVHFYFSIIHNLSIFSINFFLLFLLSFLQYAQFYIGNNQKNWTYDMYWQHGTICGPIQQGISYFVYYRNKISYIY